MSINGRVVDKAGKPVAHARVTFHPTRLSDRNGGGPVDGLIESYETDADGKFSIPSSPSMLQEVTLHAATPLPPKAFAPVRAPFTDLTGARIIPGKPIVVSKNGDTDVGDVPLTVLYGLVILRLQDVAGSPCFKRNRDHPVMRLRVRSANGHAVSEGDVPASAIDDDTSSIGIALPQGQWKVEVAVAKRKVKWHAHHESLNIRSPGNLGVTLRMPSCK